MHILTEQDNFLLKFEDSVKECWSKPALDDYNISSRTYGEVAAEIEKNLLFWKAAGLKAGDKIAINAKSCSAWAITFFASQIGKYVSVQLFPGFTPNDTENLVNHSDTRLLYTEKTIFEKMDFASMPLLIGAIDIFSGELLASREGFDKVYAKREEIFQNAHPNGFSKEDVDYSDCSLDILSSIMYTSGSTGNPKGVMLSNRNFSANIYMLPNHVPYRRGENYVSVLPYAHIFGLTVDMIASLCFGLHLVVLYVPPVPTCLKPALREFKPSIFFTVPLILTKLIEDTIGEFIHSKTGAAKLEDYKNNPDFCDALATIFMKALGGNIEMFCTGGAAIPEQFEDLFVTKLKLPFATGYGMTESAPVISIGTIGKYKLKECGEYLEEVVDVRIDSPDPAKIPGEILIKGEIVFSGYYKNEAATKAAFTPEGWFHTGDLATIDKDRSLFIVGRCKSMILSSNGQNIFPEEIEVVLNALPYVGESLIVPRNERLVAIIVPDPNRTEMLDASGLKKIMDTNIEVLNSKIPVYSHVSGYELRFEPFAKTPKGSIRRFMYE